VCQWAWGRQAQRWLRAWGLLGQLQRPQQADLHAVTRDKHACQDVSVGNGCRGTPLLLS
jgi:hypothetical protein